MTAEEILDVTEETFQYIKRDYPNADKTYKMSSFVSGACDFAVQLAKYHDTYTIEFGRKLDSLRFKVFGAQPFNSVKG